MESTTDAGAQTRGLEESKAQHTSLVETCRGVVMSSVSLLRDTLRDMSSGNLTELVTIRGWQRLVEASTDRRLVKNTTKEIDLVLSLSNRLKTNAHLQIHHETGSELTVTARKQMHVTANCITAALLCEPRLQGGRQHLHRTILTSTSCSVLKVAQSVPERRAHRTH
jgi:hypothetical protein